MANVVEITDDSFEKDIIKAGMPAIVDFWAEWCGPCRAMAPVLQEVAAEFAGIIKVAKINVDDNIKIATELSIMNIPTLVFFKDGREAGRLVGVASKSALVKKIAELFNE